MDSRIVLTREQIVAALGEAALAELLPAEQQGAASSQRHLRAVADVEEATR